MFVRILLILALLFAQTGGLVHGVAHACEPAQHHDSSLPIDHGKHCDWCAAYGQLGSALGSYTPVLGANPVGATLPSAHFGFCPARAFAAFAARAPPASR